MNNEQPSTRIQLIRDSATLQLKLLADGLRDALLIPISLVATVIGLLRGGEDCDQEFRRVLKLGRRSERWINLFGHQRPLGANTVGQMDKILEQVESVVVDQYKKGHGTAEIRKAVREALKTKEGDSKPQ